MNQDNSYIIDTYENASQYSDFDQHDNTKFYLNGNEQRHKESGNWFNYKVFAIGCFHAACPMIM